MRNILAATDFSPKAEFAMHRAAILARRHKATLHLLNVIDEHVLLTLRRALIAPPPITEERFCQSTRTELEDMAAALQTEYSVPVQQSVSTGRVHEQINAYARRHAIDLAVLGAHGEHFVRDLFIGSTVSKYVRIGAGPVLIVRSEPREPYHDVLVPIDFSESSTHALKLAATVAPDALIRALHVYDVPFEGLLWRVDAEDERKKHIRYYRAEAKKDADRQMAKLFADSDMPLGLKHVVVHGYAPRTILEQAATYDADLIVMGKHGDTEIKNLLLGSVIKHVLAEADRDVLVVSAGQRR